MKQLFLLLCLIFLSTRSFAADFDLCVCQTGTSPRGQVGFFKLGCKFWNATQSCTKKMTAGFDDSLDELLAQHPATKKLRLGYVGHWSSARASSAFLQNQIVPLVKKHDVAVSVDNTACLATDNPYFIQKYLRSVPEVAGRIDFRGNQAISTGMWDKLFEGKNNFWARVSGDPVAVTFPACREFEGKVCSRDFQKNGTGVCEDQNEGTHVFLRCQEETRTVTRMPPGGKRPERVKEKVGFWRRMKLDFEVSEKSFYSELREKSNQLPGLYLSFSRSSEAQAFLDLVDRDVRELLKRQAGVN